MEESVTLELLMMDILYSWLVGWYFPAAGVTKKFSMNLHAPICNFFTRARKSMFQVQWILKSYIIRTRKNLVLESLYTTFVKHNS